MSYSTDPGTKTAAELEREVEGTRARLTGTIEELKERVSPGQIFEQALDYVKGSGGQEFVSNLGTSVRDNPLPVLLIGAGVAWLMMSGGRDRTRDYEPGQRLLPAPRRTASVYAGPHDRDEQPASGPSLGERVGGAAASLREGAGDAAAYARDTAYAARDRAGSAYTSARDAADDAYATARDAAGDLADRASGAYAQARDTVADAANRAGEAASEAWQGVKRGARNVTSSVSDNAYRLADRGYQAVPDVGEGLNRLTREQPLLVGGLGLVIGAAIGAALPSSEAEDRLLGETRDQVAAQVQELASQGYQQAKEVAGEHLANLQDAATEAYGRAKEGIQSTGLSPQSGAEALTQVAREVREAVEKTARDVAGQARDATGDKPQA